MAGGRPKGSVNKKTAAMQAELAAAGTETPLEYMLRVMGDRTAEHSRRDDMAKAAAPYLHAKLASIEHKGPDGGAIVIKVVKYTNDGNPSSE